MDMMRIVEEYESRFMPEFSRTGKLIVYKHDVDAISHPVRLLMEKMHHLRIKDYNCPVPHWEYAKYKKEVRVCIDCGIISNQIPRYCKYCTGTMILMDQVGS